MDESRIPILVGSGQITQREPDPGAALSPMDLTAQAARIAAEDSRAGDPLLASLDTLVMLRSALNRPSQAFLIPGVLLGLAGVLALVAGVVSTLENGSSLVVLGGTGFLLLFASGNFSILGLLAELARNKSGSLIRQGRRVT